MSSKYVKVSLPQEFADKINPYIESGLYRSFAEFVKEAVRLRLEELEKNKQREEAGSG